MRRLNDVTVAADSLLGRPQSHEALLGMVLGEIKGLHLQQRANGSATHAPHSIVSVAGVRISFGRIGRVNPRVAVTVRIWLGGLLTSSKPFRTDIVE